jgi:hypothetical protein
LYVAKGYDFSLLGREFIDTIATNTRRCCAVSSSSTWWRSEGDV